MCGGWSRWLESLAQPLLTWPSSRHVRRRPRIPCPTHGDANGTSNRVAAPTGTDDTHLVSQGFHPRDQDRSLRQSALALGVNAVKNPHGCRPGGEDRPERPVELRNGQNAGRAMRPSRHLESGECMEKLSCSERAEEPTMLTHTPHLRHLPKCNFRRNMGGFGIPQDLSLATPIFTAVGADRLRGKCTRRNRLGRPNWDREQRSVSRPMRQQLRLAAGRAVRGSGSSRADGWRTPASRAGQASRKVPDSGAMR